MRTGQGSLVALAVAVLGCVPSAHAHRIAGPAGPAGPTEPAAGKASGGGDLAPGPGGTEAPAATLAFARGDLAAALVASEPGGAGVAADLGPEVSWIRALTLVHLGRLGEARVIMREGSRWSPAQRLSVEALWAEREGDPARALKALAAAHAVVPPGSPEAQFLAAKLGVRARELSPQDLRRAAVRIGVLLPTAETYGSWVDVQRAAAHAAVVALADSEVVVELLWEGEVESPDAVTSAIERLRPRGVRGLLAPLRAREARAAVTAARDLRLVRPGPASGSLPGLGPSLAARVSALVGQARARGLGVGVVLAPSNPYGDEFVAAVQAASGGLTWSVQRYAPETTSFAPIVRQLPSEALGGRGVVLVGDQARRLELLLRQLRRTTSGPAEGRAFTVFATAEGLDPETLERSKQVWEGVCVAPLAVERPEDAAFVRAYVRAEGRPPSAEALLVGRGLEALARGQSVPEVAARVYDVVQGRLVAAPG